MIDRKSSHDEDMREEYGVNKIIVESYNRWIRQSMSGCSASRQLTRVNDVEFYATSSHETSVPKEMDSEVQNVCTGARVNRSYPALKIWSPDIFMDVAVIFQNHCLYGNYLCHQIDT